MKKALCNFFISGLLFGFFIVNLHEGRLAVSLSDLVLSIINIHWGLLLINFEN